MRFQCKQSLILRAYIQNCCGEIREIYSAAEEAGRAFCLCHRAMPRSWYDDRDHPKALQCRVQLSRSLCTDAKRVHLINKWPAQTRMFSSRRRLRPRRRPIIQIYCLFAFREYCNALAVRARALGRAAPEFILSQVRSDNYFDPSGPDCP